MVRSLSFGSYSKDFSTRYLTLDFSTPPQQDMLKLAF